MGQVILDEVREAKELLLSELDGFGSTCPECILETVSNLWGSGLSNEGASMSVATYDRDLSDRCWSVRGDSEANLALGLGLPIGIVAHLWTLGSCYVLLAYCAVRTRSTEALEASAR